MDASEGIHALLERARAGDRNAIRELLDWLQPRMEREARGYVDGARPAESVSDLVQEATIRIWQALADFRGADAEGDTARMLEAWAQQIVRRQGLNAIRDGKAQKRHPQDRRVVALPDDSFVASPLDLRKDPTPSSVVREREASDRVGLALESIADATTRRVVSLRVVEGRSLRDVSEQLAISFREARRRYEEGLAVIERALQSGG